MGTRDAPYAPVRGFFLGGFGGRRLGVSIRTKIAATSARPTALSDALINQLVEDTMRWCFVSKRKG